MFAIKSDGLRTITSYDEARRLWESIKPWKNGKDEKVKPLGPRARKNKTLVKYSDRFAARLYETDTVIYYDGGIEVSTHESMSSKIFVNAVAPRGVEFWSLHDVYFFKIAVSRDAAGEVTETRYYKPGRDYMSLVMTGDFTWEVSTPRYYDTWGVHTLDKAKARRALKESGYLDFVPWVTMTRDIRSPPPRPRQPHQAAQFTLALVADMPKVFDILSNRQKWGELIPAIGLRKNKYSQLVYLDRHDPSSDFFLTRLRLWLYNQFGALSVAERPYFTNIDDVEACIHAGRLYGRS